jgi:hypothetical protein
MGDERKVRVYFLNSFPNKKENQNVFGMYYCALVFVLTVQNKAISDN